jgi:hypothetical protein
MTFLDGCIVFTIGFLAGMGSAALIIIHNERHKKRLERDGIQASGK